MYYIYFIWWEKEKKTSGSERSLLSFYHSDLVGINNKILDVKPEYMPSLFANIPLDVFGYLYLIDKEEYKNIKTYLSTMPSKEVQLTWTGAHGQSLLLQSIAFVKNVVSFYSQKSTVYINNTAFLDFGCGWGRIIRLFLKYIPETNLFGVDPWDKSLELCIQHKVRGKFEQSDWLCRNLPFENKKFDLVIAMSVFTHLSKRTMNEALRTIRSRVTDNAIFAVTVRPAEFWETYKIHCNPNICVNDYITRHQCEGFVFIPHMRPQIDGDITYGDTSISLDYINDNWHGWEVVGTDVSLLDSAQIIVYLKPC